MTSKIALIALLSFAFGMSTMSVFLDLMERRPIDWAFVAKALISAGSSAGILALSL